MGLRRWVSQQFSADGLPVQQLSVLALCRLAEPIALTSVLPYLPSILRSYHIPESDIAFWAGICAAAYSAANALTALPWGWLSDRFGRKRMIVLGLLCNASTALLWGFSVNLPMAVVARALTGAGNGNVGVQRTMIGEMSGGLTKAQEARMFSILPMVYNFGAMVGPAFGGALANPLHRSPGDHAKRKDLFWIFPFALPNLVCTVLFLVSALLAFLFLGETLSTRKGSRDCGLEMGEKLKSRLRRVSALRWHVKVAKAQGEGEQEPLLTNGAADLDDDCLSIFNGTVNLPTDTGAASLADDKRPIKILNQQTIISLAVYGLVPIQFFSYDQMVSWLMAYPRSGPDVSETHLPFKFSRGFEMTSKDMGVFFTAMAVVGIFNQYWSAKIYGRYGILRCLRLGLLMTPLLFAITPFCVLPATLKGQLVSLALLWILKGILVAFIYPCSTILVKNSAPSQEVLGTVNGIATAVAAIGRGIGAAIAGPAFTYGAKNGYMVPPFWIMGLIAISAPVVALWVVEKEEIKLVEAEQTSR